MLDADVAELERAQIAPRLGDERTDPFDRVDVVAELRQYRGLVTAPRADLEHAPTRAPRAQQFGHARDDVRLRNRLSGANRQRRILVGADRERLLDEDMARNGGHRGEHTLVDDPLLAQPLDHAGACPRRRHSDAVEFLDAGDHADVPSKRAASHALTRAISA